MKGYINLLYRKLICIACTSVNVLQCVSHITYSVTYRYMYYVPAVCAGHLVQSSDGNGDYSCSSGVGRRYLMIKLCWFSEAWCVIKGELVPD